MAKSLLCQALEVADECSVGYLEMGYQTESNTIWKMLKSKGV
jgi:hypothetical protein